MELSAEDALRLNVLVANAKAIRINESKMTVHGLTDRGEVSINLQPTGNEDRYVKRVREFLATHAVGFPRGYPVFLRRWTRMHSLDSDRLQPLLMLGEPEAVVAVSGASGITPELAALAWWALPESEVARFLLASDRVAEDELGRELAAHLLEFLPFETEPADIIETVRLISREGLIDESDLLRLWHRGARKTAYLAGFLLGRGDDLPDTMPPNPSLAAVKKAAAEKPDDRLLAALCRILEDRGQLFLATIRRILARPASQEVVVETLEALRDYVGLEELRERECATTGEIETEIESIRLPVTGGDGDLREKLIALLTLALGGEPLVRGYYARSTAVGSLMRKQLAPILEPLERSIEVLLHAPE